MNFHLTQSLQYHLSPVLQESIAIIGTDLGIVLALALVIASSEQQQKLLGCLATDGTRCRIRWAYLFGTELSTNLLQ
jgi:hypothetical protein